MIKFILNKSCKKFTRNFKCYWLITIEMLIATMIIGLFLNINFSINNQYVDLLKEGKDKTLDLRFSPKTNNDIMKNFDYSSWVNGKAEPFEYKNKDIIPFTYDDYLNIKNKYKNDLSISFFVRRDFYREDKKENLFMFFVSDEVLTHLKKYAKESFENSNIAYCGGNFKEYLGKVDINRQRDIVFTYSKDELNNIRFYNNKVLKLEKIPDYSNKDILFLLKGVGISSNEKVSSDNFMIIPIEYYFDFFHPKDLNAFNVSISFGKANLIATLAPEILKYLRNVHGNSYNYNVNSDLSSYISKTETIRDNSLAANIIAIFSVIIIIIGLTGILLMVVNRRKKEFAISIALGASKINLFVELLIESTFITTLGGIVGIIIDIIILKSNVINFNEFNIFIDYRAIGLALLISFLVGWLSSIIPLIKIRKLMPIEILNDL